MKSANNKHICTYVLYLHVLYVHIVCMYMIRYVLILVILVLPQVHLSHPVPVKQICAPHKLQHQQEEHRLRTES